MLIYIIFGLIVLIILLLSIKFVINTKIKTNSEDIALKNFLESQFSEMRKFFIHESSNKNNFDDLSIINMLQFTYFREYCGAKLYSLFMSKINTEGIGWLKIPDSIKIKNKELRNIISDIALEFANSDSFIDNNIAIIYADYISTNINDLEKLEKEAIDFNKSFGEDPEGEPELHPKDTQLDQYIDDQDSEINIDTLSSTGTVEYLD